MDDKATLDEDLVIDFEPISTVAGTVNSITIREPTAAQIAQWTSLEGTASQMRAVSICGSVPIAVVEQMKARPFTRAVRRIESFLA